MGIEWKGSPNYETGGAAKIGVMPHIMEGWLEGTNSSFLQPSRQASTQYGVGGSKIYQWVKEEDTSWHCGNYYYNQALISIEHEGFTDSPPSRETLDTSAELMADIARRHGWSYYALGENVFLHRDVYATSCPATMDIDYLVAKANELLGGDMPITEPEMQMIEQRVAAKVWTFAYPGQPAAYEQLYQGLSAQIQAQTAAIKALANAQGADPEQIADIVEKAVAEKLASLKITIA